MLNNNCFIIQNAAHRVNRTWLLAKGVRGAISQPRCMMGMLGLPVEGRPPVPQLEVVDRPQRQSGLL